MISALALMSIHKSPTIQLRDVCMPCFGLSYEEALKRAAVQKLPVPVFRLTKSQKAPLAMTAEALGAWIDEQAALAADSWKRVNA